MTGPFETVVINLQRIGAYNFLFPFMLTSAVFYGLLRKSRLFGEPEKNIAVNGVVALMAAFMMWSYPILAGKNVELPLSIFFFQGSIATIIVMVGFMIMSIFVEPGKTFGEKYGKKLLPGLVILGGLIAFGLFFTSGLIDLFAPGYFTVDTDTVLSVLVLIVLGAILIGVVWITGKEEKKT